MRKATTRGAGWDVNICTQIGIGSIIALASKNAILIVECARELRREGRGIPSGRASIPITLSADSDDRRSRSF